MWECMIYFLILNEIHKAKIDPVQSLHFTDEEQVSYVTYSGPLTKLITWLDLNIYIPNYTLRALFTEFLSNEGQTQTWLYAFTFASFSGFCFVLLFVGCVCVISVS